jgi:hypothetical protein
VPNFLLQKYLRAFFCRPDLGYTGKKPETQLQYNMAITTLLRILQKLGKNGVPWPSCTEIFTLMA